MRFAAASAVLAALVLASTALADDPTVRLNAADQAKARAALLRAADLGGGWRGGPHKPSPLKQASTCPGYDPKESDLVVTGHAAAGFTSADIVMEHDVQIMERSSFVRADFQRSFTAGLPACLLKAMRESGRTGVSSAAWVAFPRIGDVTAAVRLTMTTGGGAGPRMNLDLVAVGHGRAEHTLLLVYPAAVRSAAEAYERRLARALTARPAP